MERVYGPGCRTFRGMVLGESPVFWAAEPEYLYISVVASLFTFYIWPMVGKCRLTPG
jgi:uncharacterized membrane protein YeiH